jgi:hypothetical protein
MSLTKASYSLINGAPANILDFGAVGNGTTDDMAAIQAAVNSGAASVYAPAGSYAVSGKITVPGGVTIFGDGYKQYSSDGTRFVRIGASIFPIFAGGGMAWGLKNLYCVHGNAHTTGVISIGGTAGDVLVTQALFENVYIYGNWDSANNCGVYIYGATISTPVYYNRFSNLVVEHCGTGILLSTEANANLFTNTLTKSCRRHVWLESGALENVFVGSGFYGTGGDIPSIGAATCIFARNSTPFNVFSGFTTETSSGGQCFDTIGDTGCQYFGVVNEVTESLPGDGRWWQAPNGPGQANYILQSAAAQGNTQTGVAIYQEKYTFALTNNAYWNLLQFTALNKSNPFTAILDVDFTFMPPDSTRPVTFKFSCQIVNRQTLNDVFAQTLSTNKSSNASSWITDFEIVTDNTGSLPVSLLVKTANNGAWGASTSPLATLSYKLTYSFLNSQAAISKGTKIGALATAGEIAAATIVTT